VVLILVGLVGLVLGDKLWLGILNIDNSRGHRPSGHGRPSGLCGLQRNGPLNGARSVVLALGVIYLVVGILGFLVPMMFGRIPDGYTIFDDLLHLALGVLGLAVTLAASGGSTQTGRSASA
jgi:hypothetical protein